MKSALFSILLAGVCWLTSCQNREDNANVTVDTLEISSSGGIDSPTPVGTLRQDTNELSVGPSSSGQQRIFQGAATFQAILPCDGCDGIRTRMILNYDSSSFFFRQVYLGRIDPDTLRLRSGRFERIMGPEKTMILRFESAKEAAPFFMKELGDSALAFLAKDGSDAGKGRRAVLKRTAIKP